MLCCGAVWCVLLCFVSGQLVACGAADVWRVCLLCFVYACGVCAVAYVCVLCVRVLWCVGGMWLVLCVWVVRGVCGQVANKLAARWQNNQLIGGQLPIN